jgi:hypothetical protein
MQENPLSLEEVKSHFEHYRATRIKSREKIPQHLWDKVKTLIDRYQLQEITKVLRLNTYQIRDNLGIKPKITFAEAKVEPAPIFSNRSFLSPSDKGQTYSVELQRPNGTLLRISSLSSDSINKIISQFMV